MHNTAAGSAAVHNIPEDVAQSSCSSAVCVCVRVVEVVLW